MNLAQIIIIFLLGFNILGIGNTIVTSGKPREPLTPRMTGIIVAVQFVMVLALAYVLRAL